MEKVALPARPQTPLVVRLSGYGGVVSFGLWIFVSTIHLIARPKMPGGPEAQFTTAEILISLVGSLFGFGLSWFLIAGNRWGYWVGIALASPVALLAGIVGFVVPEVSLASVFLLACFGILSLWLYSLTRPHVREYFGLAGRKQPTLRAPALWMVAFGASSFVPYFFPLARISHGL